ncbi:MAG: DNA/RNA non-specific endonuclease [Kiritimatiellae bacterium]|nr:DNA/RNA non-specific endonuclease [Kiritimatiellia bacterium]
MARKAAPKKSKKKPSASSSFRLSRRMKGILSAVALVIVLGFGNWFAHLPAARRAEFGALETSLEKLGLVTAGFTDAIGLTGRDASVPYSAKLPTQNKFFFGKIEITNSKKAVKDIKLLKRQGYWVGWSPMCGHPAYAVYTVPTSKVLDEPPERPAFMVDPEAPDCPDPSDYTRTGYDRGHMAPNYLIATRYGKAAQRETFFMSNIVPQSPVLNRGPWRILEQIVAKDLTKQDVELWVITGPVPAAKQTYISRGKARIPKGFFKIIASVKEGRLRAIGAYMPQNIRSDKHPRYCLTSIDAIEEMTGFNFFSALPEAEQEKLERVEPTRFWPEMEIF